MPKYPEVDPTLTTPMKRKKVNFVEKYSDLQPDFLEGSIAIVRETKKLYYLIDGEWIQDTGLQGQKGDKGDTGSAGQNGASGQPGSTGPTGAKGDQGIPGLQGSQGQIGPQGLPGSAGAVGATGAKGDKGDTGNTGSQGIAGTPGSQGVAGPKGDTGNAGATGSQGIQGLKGDKGDTGSTGAAGSVGATGPAGSNGTNGATGAAGPQGIAGFSLMTITTPTRVLDTAFQVHATVGSFVNYSILISATLSVAVGQAGKVELQTCPTSTGTFITRAVTSNSNTGTLAVTLSQTSVKETPLCCFVPAGHYVKLKKTLTTGTPTISITSQMETVFA